MDITKELLQHHYISLGKSTCQIAKELNVPKYAICNAMNRFKIPMRSLREALRPKSSANIPGHKWCPVCKNDLPFADFSKNSRSVSGLCDRCRVCTAKIAKKYYAPRMAKRRRLKAQVVINMGDQCSRCKASGLPLACYQFHHRDPSVKEKNMYHAISPSGIDQSEVDKCDLVCANCHLIIHHGLETAAEAVDK